MEALLSEISRLFSLAEQKIKLIEHIGVGLTFPAVNQLRYVAFHLLRAFNTTDENLKGDELRKAKNHCERAIYDAVEAGIVYYLEKIRIFQEDYETVVITDIMPNYLEIPAKANQAHDFILQRTKYSVGDHCSDQGDQYQEATALFEELRDINHLLTNARIEINKKLKKSRTTFLVSVATLIVTIIGVVVGIIVALLK